jgi:DNA (cytosine-5)-methyltransferase 1
MKYLSICSGIEAASVAFEPLGWRPLAFSEIEAFPRAVLKHHYPDTPCHGDFTLLKDEPWIVDADMLCGGTPCQAFSVAGNRQSLADDRGNLTLQFVLLADAIDHLRSTAGREPAWILWENVPGVLSTNDNAFGAFLGGLVGRTAPIPEPADGWPSAGVVDGPTRCAAWRILDAQHFGLAQRRKRVFVLARGGAGRWAVADALLPIIEGSRWHPAPSRGKGEGVAATITSGAANGGPAHGARSGSAKEGNLIPEVTRPLTAAMDTKWNGNGDLESSLIPSVVGTLTANMVGCAGTPGYNETEHILPMLMSMREGKEGGGKGPLVSEDQSLTLATGNDQVLATVGTLACNTGPNGHDAGNFQSNQGVDAGYVQPVGMQVRRLTPRECERLQGFPDDYTLIPIGKRNKAAEEEEMRQYLRLTSQQWEDYKWSADGPRYKALGNSWAVPCARWIGERIKAIRP